MALSVEELVSHRAGALADPESECGRGVPLPLAREALTLAVPPP